MVILKTIPPTRMLLVCALMLGIPLGSSMDTLREERSLTNTFPFNNVEDALPSRETRQGLDKASSIPFSEVASSYAGGKRWERIFPLDIF